MYLLIQYPAGVVVEAMVLAKKRTRMRIVARGFADTIELKRSGSSWVIDGGQQVELEFLLSTSRGTPNADVGAMQFAQAN